MGSLWINWLSASLVLALFIVSSLAHDKDEDYFETNNEAEIIDGYKYVEVRHPEFDGLTDWQYRLIFAEDQPKTKKPWSVRETLKANIDGEPVTCQLPAVRVPLEPEAAVSEKDPNTLLQPLSGACVKMMEGAWTYEVCYFQSIRQYLETGVQKTMRISHNYVLGRYMPLADDPAGTERRKLPQMLYGSKKYPYHSQWYRDGTVCDLTGRPRETELRFFCHEKSTQIVEIDEIATCSYQISVGTPLLCIDPIFQTAPQVVSNVMCKGSDKAKTYDLAKRLQAMSEATAEHFWDWDRPIHQGGERDGNGQSADSEAHSTAESGQGADIERIRIMLPPGKDGQRIVLDLDQFGNVLPAQKAAGQDHVKELLSPKNSVTHYYSNSKKKRKTPTGLCFTAADGQWRFQVCLDDFIAQWPQGADKSIVLGEWKKEAHLDWLNSLPPDQRANTVTDNSVMLWYSDGDFCEAIRSNRAVALTLECTKADDNTPVTLDYEEQSTCRYTLVLGSPKLCAYVAKYQSLSKQVA